ncbi:MAG TPA: 6-phosphogluconolactonase [Sumerlaeia bacterium]|nr:6-phosphogluconolactonase [Sumerlaeia bacterium]
MGKVGECGTIGKKRGAESTSVSGNEAVELRQFDNVENMTRATVGLLAEAFRREGHAPYGVMLSGGRTPLNAYGTLTRNPVVPSTSLHILFSDERVAPPDSPQSNYGNARAMIRALGVPEDRVLRVRGEIPVDEAAERYDRDLAGFIDKGGSLPLGLLGLGADGHTASLFSLDDVERARRRFAVPVSREPKPDRVSVTPDLLARFERIVFLVSGPEKAGVIETLLREPAALPAGRAVARASRVEIWAS